MMASLHSSHLDTDTPVARVMWALQIDDDEDDLEMFGDAVALYDPSIRIDGVQSLEKALTLCLKESRMPDFIVLDINMPRNSGFDCYLRFKADKKFHNTRFIFLSTTIYPQEMPQDSFFMKKQNSLDAYVALLQRVLDPNLTPQP